MKKLGIDARLYRQTGVGVYIRNLLLYLEKTLPAEVTVFVYLRKEDFDTVTFNNKNFIKRETDFQWHTLSEQTDFLKALNKDELDLMHFTYFSYPIFYRRPFISTIHDLTPYLFKTGRASTKGPLRYGVKHFFFGRILKAQIKKGKAIITPTQVIKDQIIKHFGKKYADKIHPIPEGINEEIKKTKEADLKRQFPKDFLIYIGNFYPHKNVEKLIRAFAKVNEEVELVLAGPDDFFTKRIEETIYDLKASNKVLLYKNPSQEDLVFFYKNAKALINPSLSEGFGLTTIEAAYFKTPILASDIAVFQEVLGDSYMSFNPNDEDDIAATIFSFLKHKPRQNYSFLKKYSFEKMTEETVKLYKTHLNL